MSQCDDVERALHDFYPDLPLIVKEFDCATMLGVAFIHNDTRYAVTTPATLDSRYMDYREVVARARPYIDEVLRS